MKDSIAIFGTGAWGTGLACAFARAGNNVAMYGVDQGEIDDINNNKRNSKYFGDLTLPDNIRAFDDMKEALTVSAAKTIALVVPSKVFDSVLGSLQEIIINEDLRKYNLIVCSKGLDVSTNWLLTQRVREFFPTANVACIGGPNFAAEVASGKPSATTLACLDLELSKDLAQKLSSDTFKIYPSSDPDGVSMCGVLKNVYAIGAGMLQAMGFGASSQSFYITRALAEMKRIISFIGGDKDTVTSLAGVGDLVLCCTNDTSRNMKFGIEFGKCCLVSDENGNNNKESMLDMDSKMTIEGIRSIKVMYEYVNGSNIDAPIIKEIYMILFENKKVSDIINDMMNRPIRAEGD